VEFRSFSLPRKIGITAPPFLVLFAAVLSVFGFETGRTFYPFALIGAIGVCILVVSALVAWVSAKSFLLSGSLNLLFLSLAMLTFGTLSILGSLVGEIAPTAGTLVYLVGLLIAGSLHFVSGLLTFVGSPQRKSKLRLRAVVSYGGAITFMGGISVWAIESGFPPVGQFMTKIIVGSTAVLFLAAAFLFSKVYLSAHSSTLFWYTLGLTTTGVSFVALLSAQNTGDLGTWTGIGGVLLGSLYFLISVIKTPKNPSQNNRKL
jgi:hypothetical protein